MTTRPSHNFLTLTPQSDIFLSLGFVFGKVGTSTSFDCATRSALLAFCFVRDKAAGCIPLSSSEDQK